MKLHHGIVTAAIAFAFVLSPTFAAGQQSANSAAQKTKTEAICPMHAAHMRASAKKERPAKEANQHTHKQMHEQLNERGEKGMGFSQSATTHHFVLEANGGAIHVEANDPADAATRDAIRQHLTHIAQAFANGDFDIPMFLHATVPPGVPDMKRLRGKIAYSYEQTPQGGRVVLKTQDNQALEAIHKFLRFQIAEHYTSDPTALRLNHFQRSRMLR